MIDADAPMRPGGGRKAKAAGTQNGEGGDSGLPERGQGSPTQGAVRSGQDFALREEHTSER